MTVQTNLDHAIENYGEAAKAASTKKLGKTALVGFGAAAASGLFTASQAEAGIVYSGVLNIGFAVSTVNSSATNAISPPLVFNSLGGAVAFGIAGNNRGPANPVGTTDILWAVGAGYPVLGGFGGVLALPGTAFPTTVVAQPYRTVVGGGAAGTPASLAWAAVGLVPAPMAIDPFGLGTAGPNTVTGYFGFTFNTSAGGAGQQLFGWARVVLTGDGIRPTSFTLRDWAYEDTGAPIHVGSVIPEPATTGVVGLCALAAGAAGIRRRKASKVAS